MSDWTAKRFWKEATTKPEASGFSIALDGRAVKTPAKATLIVPTQAMADAIAAEWDAQVEKIDPSLMPVTRGANAAIDKVTPQFDEVVALLAAYGGTDLLCYRAASPVELIERQTQNWDPLLEWAANTYGVRLLVGVGVMHVAQTSEGQDRLTAELQKLTSFQLAAAHDLISMSGSLVLALAVMTQYISAAEGWRLSRIDEDWQAEKWGDDEEATELADIKKTAFLDAARFFQMSVT
jgi:chaperone required for assembly of F1-ATPase